MNLVSVSSRWRRARLALTVAAAATIIALWYFSARLPPVPRRTLRIGFESNPPVQIRTEDGFSGLAVETVNEAAKRAGIKLEWVETGTSSDEAFQKGLVDIWPLMVDFPERRKYVHFARPWMHSSDVLLVRDGSPNLDHSFKGRLAVFKMPLHIRIAREQFPEAVLVEVPEIEDILKQVCNGADAGFIEARVAVPLLRQRSQECPSMALRLQSVPGLKFDAGLASTFESARAADQIQREIDNMFRDGILATLIAKYSYFGLDDTWASYEQMEAERKWHWLMWASGGLVFALGLTLWQASSLRQRKRAEGELRESEERFRNIADSAPVIVWVCGPNGAITFTNRFGLNFVGQTKEQDTGAGWTNSLHPEDNERVASEISSAIAGRCMYQISFRLRRADGEYRWMLAKGVPRFAGDVYTGHIGITSDITELKQSQEQLQTAQKLESLGVLAGGIAHDFNNLLGGILAEAELVEPDLAVGSAPREEIQRIKTAAIRGSEIVRQLMIYAGENQTDLNEAVDVPLLVEEMVKLLRVSISKQVALRTDFSGDLPTVLGSAPQIRQVMMNLVLNASEAIGNTTGTITVTAAQVSGGRELAPNSATDLTPGDYLRIEVSDSGCGMTEEIKAKIFDPFFSTKFPGRGLGLAVVLGIVRHLGGAINIVSAPGQGTVFQVFLPSAPNTASEIHSAMTFGGLEKSNVQAGTILLVEDEETLRRAVSKGLSKRGFSVIEAIDGSGALDLIHTHKDEIDVILLDVTLPGASSREVFEEALRIRPDLKVIVTSAYDKETVDAYYSGLRIDHFIRKPFRLDDLVRLSRIALSAKN